MFIPSPSKSDTGNTPEYILKPVREFFQSIDLDPCSNPGSIVNAKNNWKLPEHDGLKENWFGNVFVNPPFGRPLKDWISKSFEENFYGRANVIMLCPANTDTKIFHEYVFPTATAVCFIKGRITFLNCTAPIYKPCCYIYWGDQPGRFTNYFAVMGHVSLV
jgi:hypothetical protein